MRQTTVATIGVLIAFGMVAAPGVLANHAELSQSQRYLIGGDIIILNCGDDTLPGIGGVCFDLTGKEHELDLQIKDDVLDRIARTSRTLQRLLDGAENNGEAFTNSVIDDAQEELDGTKDVVDNDTYSGIVDDVNSAIDSEQGTVAGAAGGAIEEGAGAIGSQANPLLDETSRLGPVGAVYEFDAPFGANGFFCQTQIIIAPNNATGLDVFLDGAIFGNPLLTVCGTLTSTAIAGTVFLNVEVDP